MSNQASTMSRVAVAAAGSCTRGSMRKANQAVRTTANTRNTSKPTHARL